MNIIKQVLVFQEMLDGGKSHPELHNKTGEQIVTNIATVKVDFRDYQARQESVIHGAAGEHIDFQNIQGPVHTSSNDGNVVERDKSFHIRPEIASVSKEAIQQYTENLSKVTQQYCLKFFSEPAKSAGPHPKLSSENIKRLLEHSKKYHAKSIPENSCNRSS